MKTLYDGRDFRCSVTFFPPPLSLSLSCARAVPSIPSDGANNSQTVAIAPVSLTPTSFYGHHPRGQVESFLAVDADDDAHNAESMLLVQRLLKKCVTNIRYSVLFCFSPQSLPRFSRAAAVHGAQGGPLRMCALHPFSLYRFVCVCIWETN